MVGLVVILPILSLLPLGEPEVAIRAGRDSRGLPGSGDGELGDDAGRVIRPIWLSALSGNQRFPSAPLRCPRVAVGRGIANWVIIPVGVIRPIFSCRLGEPEIAVRPRRDPRRPLLGWDGELGDDTGRGDPPDLFAVVCSANQRLPSGPARSEARCRASGSRIR